ncbi:MAG: T9SS type A sorting domain-containing protein [Bacteroidota bacterium]
MKPLRLISLLIVGVLWLSGDLALAQTTATIGTGSSSSSTRGPFQRADTNSSTVFSRFVQIYTAAEMAAAQIPSGASITQFNWELASSNVIIGSGSATLKIYVRNSNATAAVSDTWVNHIAGSTLAYDDSFNVTNNFPGANGWMPFALSTPITYTGGALEIAVDWDCSQVSTPAFNGNGAIKFRWASTAPEDLVVKKTSSSAPSTNITDVKNERANIQIVYSAPSCAAPANLASTVTTTTADVSWDMSTGATAYLWKVVASGAGSGGTAIAGGSTAMTMATATGLMPLTAYDLYVATDCGTDTSAYAGPHAFLTAGSAQDTATIGMGSSSSSTRGPFQRSDTASSTVFSRFVQVYTAAELAAAGITNGASITQVSWELASSNVMIGSGNATMKVYIKNSSATAAMADTWVNQINGATLVSDNMFNTSNNFPGQNGWMPFAFSTPYVYTGGALEIAVDWDCSQVTTPAFSGDGSLKWRWESTAPDFLVVKKTASSSPSSNITDLKDERANIQFVYTAPAPACTAPSGLSAANLTATSADLSWSNTGATAYLWKVVATGAGSGGAAVEGGATADTFATASSLMGGTTYDLFVASDCGTDTSAYAGPYTFSTTMMVMDSTVTIGTNSSSSSTRGPFQRSDTASSTVYSRFVQVYTATELAAVGITDGASINQVAWELASSNVMIGTGDATMKVYIRNSTATAAAADDWSNLIAGSSLVSDNAFNTTNNFPGQNGWMPFAFNAPFVYTGGAIEVAVDWDCSQVSTPAFSGDGSLKWRWSSTAPDSLVVKKTSSSGPSSNISDLKDERANIQFTFTPPVCNPSTAIMSAITNVSCKGESDGAIDLTVTAGVPSYSFSWNNAAGDTTEDISGLAAGDYMVTITDGDGCDFTSTITITEPDSLILSVSTTADSAGTGIGAASASATGGTAPYSYTWDGTAGPADTTGLASGTYEVVVTDVNGCTDTLSVTVDDVVSIDAWAYVADLSIIPNPTTGLARIELNLTEVAELDMTVFSMRGELVGHFPQGRSTQLKEELDLSAWANGVYFVRFSINNQVISKRILLQR